jgi:hypothetical protein
MPNLVPVDNDPFAAPAAAGSPPPAASVLDAPSPSLVPVDHDPFAGAPPAKSPAFPQDDPRYQYGSVLPFAKETATGNINLAVPEIIRSPVRGLLDIGQRVSGPLTPEKLHALNSDEQGLVLSAGGLRPSIDAPMPAAANPPRPAAVTARQAGYVLPPASISENPGLVSSVLAGWSGKIKTAQAAAAKNQVVTNDLATRALGLPSGTVLTDEVLGGIRAQAGKAYQAVSRAVPSIKADKEYADIVDQLGGRNGQAAKMFPKITNNPGLEEMVQELKGVTEFPTEAGVELVKELRFNANANLKAIGDPSQHALGLAQREAANAVDDLMERNIEATGQPGVIDAYKAARRLIAKSYDVEGVTNSATGDVNARGLARLQDKGRPLTDELKTIADSASAFPRSMRTPSEYGDNEAWSALDFFGSAAALAHGNPSVAGMILGRPAARSVILSSPYQNMLTRPGAPTPAPLRLPVNPGLLGSPDLSQSGAPPDLSNPGR